MVHNSSIGGLRWGGGGRGLVANIKSLYFLYNWVRPMPHPS